MVRLRCIFFLFIVFTCFLFSSYSICTKNKAYSDNNCNTEITDVWIIGSSTAWPGTKSCFIGIKSNYYFVYAKSGWPLQQCGIEAESYRDVSTYKKNDRGKDCVVAYGDFWSCDKIGGKYDDIRNECVVCSGKKAIETYGCSGDSLQTGNYPNGFCSVACGADEFCQGLDENNKFRYEFWKYCSFERCKVDICNSDNNCKRVTYYDKELVCVYDYLTSNSYMWLDSKGVSQNFKEHNCGDSIDNDCDGKIDAADEDCWCNVTDISSLFFLNEKGNVISSIDSCEGKFWIYVSVKVDKPCPVDKIVRVEIKNKDSDETLTSFNVKVGKGKSSGENITDITFTKNKISTLSGKYVAIAENKESGLKSLDICCVELNSFNLNPSSTTECSKDIQIKALVNYNSSGKCSGRSISIKSPENTNFCNINIEDNKNNYLASCQNIYKTPQTSSNLKFLAVFSTQTKEASLNVNCEQQCQITNLNLNVTQLSKVNCGEDAKFEINVTGSQQSCNNLQALVFVDNQKVGSINCNIKQNNLFECKGNIQHNIQSPGTKEFKVDVNGKTATKSVNLNCDQQCQITNLNLNVTQLSKVNCREDAKFEINVTGEQQNCKDLKATIKIDDNAVGEINCKINQNKFECVDKINHKIQKSEKLKFKVIVGGKETSSTLNAVCERECKISKIILKGPLIFEIKNNRSRYKYVSSVDMCSGSFYLYIKVFTDVVCEEDKSFKVDVKNLNSNEIVTSYDVTIKSGNRSNYFYGEIEFDKDEISKLIGKYVAIADSVQSNSKVINICCIDLESFDLDIEETKECDKKIKLTANVSYDLIGSCINKYIYVKNPDDKRFCRIRTEKTQGYHVGYCSGYYKIPKNSQKLEFSAVWSNQVEKAFLNAIC